MSVDRRVGVVLAVLQESKSESQSLVQKGGERGHLPHGPMLPGGEGGNRFGASMK
jgi:hypothetical protein